MLGEDHSDGEQEGGNEWKSANHEKRVQERGI